MDRKKQDYSKKQKIRYITMTILLSEFLFIAVGILIFGLKQNFICLAVAVGVFLLTVIIGANIEAIKRIFIYLSIKCSKYKHKDLAEILSDDLVGGSVVNKELTKAIMSFTFDVDGNELTGFKVLKVKKLRKKRDFKDDAAFDRRIDKFIDELKENGYKLNIMYVPNKKYCVILDSADSVFNYFIVDVLFAEKNK